MYGAYNYLKRCQILQFFKQLKQNKRLEFISSNARALIIRHSHVNQAGCNFVLVFKYQFRSFGLELLVSLDIIVPEQFNPAILLNYLWNVWVPFFCCLKVVFFFQMGQRTAPAILSYRLLYSLCANLKHSQIMWLTVLSFCPQSRHFGSTSAGCSILLWMDLVLCFPLEVFVLPVLLFLRLDILYLS